MSHPVEPERPSSSGWDTTPRPVGQEAENTQVLGRPFADATPASETTRPIPVTDVRTRPDLEPRTDVARRDPRGTTEWDLQMARLANRPMTDVGLLVLRLLSLPLVLHGLHKAAGFAGFVDGLRANPIGSMAPEIFGVMVVAGQIFLPILIAVGFLTRFAGLAQAVMMGCIYAFFILNNSPVIDPKTGGLSGEAALGYAAIALPLFFTGAGRFSVDHALTAKSRERRVEKRATKRLGA